jgi:hypothetical protein
MAAHLSVNGQLCRPRAGSFATAYRRDLMATDTWREPAGRLGTTGR